MVKPCLGVLDHALRALLLAIERDESGHEQTTDNRYQSGAGGRDGGQEWSGVDGHAHRRTLPGLARTAKPPPA
jgi:hypothetical protein